jgi:hypothetical protein
MFLSSASGLLFFLMKSGEEEAPPLKRFSRLGRQNNYQGSLMGKPPRTLGHWRMKEFQSLHVIQKGYWFPSTTPSGCKLPGYRECTSICWHWLLSTGSDVAGSQSGSEWMNRKPSSPASSPSHSTFHAISLGGTKEWTLTKEELEPALNATDCKGLEGAFCPMPTTF